MASTFTAPTGLGAITALFELPFTVLMQRASAVHQQNFPQPEVELATLLSIKTGACPEDCAYCPQSAHYKTEIEIERLLPLHRVLAEARAAKQAGAQRFCMGAAWRSPRDKDLDPVLEMVEGVRALGLETCLTAGMLSAAQAQRLGAAGLDYYNHNLDTSPEYYGQIISTRTYQDRLDTLEHVRAAGMKLCVGGIVGLGESRRDRARLLEVLANMDPPPESVPINLLVRVEGTPLANEADLDPFEFVRTIAVARLLMPRSRVRLSAGRETMNEALQALCFVAGANSIFYGDKLLTTANPALSRDQALLARLGLRPARALDQAVDAAACAPAVP